MRNVLVTLVTAGSLALLASGCPRDEAARGAPPPTGSAATPAGGSADPAAGAATPAGAAAADKSGGGW